MNQTGKRARKQFGNRYAAKSAKARRGSRKDFGKLKYSMSAGTALAFVQAHSG